MKKGNWLLLVVWIIGLLVGGCGANPPAGSGNTSVPVKQEQVQNLAQLRNTEHFRSTALTHIFEGNINSAGKAGGYHYQGLPDTPGRVVPGTESAPNAQGIYKAQVEVKGQKKSDNGGQSTFFPKNMTAQQVVDAINQAYATRKQITGNTYQGQSEQGIRINMYLDAEGKIISAFPVY